VWLVFYKKDSGHPSVCYADAVREALCYGWIDSKVQSIDDARYRQMFTPRKPTSAWSALNKRHIRELTKARLMAEPGLAAIERAKRNGSWTALDQAEALELPIEMERAFRRDAKARVGYEAYTKSYKRAVIFWITSAKRDETRKRRIERAITAAREGKSPV
jgi:uncharacterized protein YdeI (YjbR/CyaY-like superfamily)